MGARDFTSEISREKLDNKQYLEKCKVMSEKYDPKSVRERT